MRKIKLDKWKSQRQVFDKVGNPTGETEEVGEDLLSALNVLIANKKPEDMPKGLDKFRTFGRLSKAFEKADESRILELEEADYKFLKDEMESSIPSTWGMNPDISKAIEEFLEAKEE